LWTKNLAFPDERQVWISIGNCKTFDSI
jgi:hypothetical protein